MYAIIDSTGEVINVVLWDGKSEWCPPESQTAVAIPAGSGAGIGWSTPDGGKTFTPPTTSAVQPRAAA